MQDQLPRIGIFPFIALERKISKTDSDHREQHGDQSETHPCRVHRQADAALAACSCGFLLHRSHKHLVLRKRKRGARQDSWSIRSSFPATKTGRANGWVLELRTTPASYSKSRLGFQVSSVKFCQPGVRSAYQFQPALRR